MDGGNTSRRWRLAAAIAAAGGLAVLSVCGSFLGAERAGEIFNSPPLAALWLVLAATLALEVAVNLQPIRSVGRLAAHLGCLLVLAGAMMGSDLAHRLAAQFFGQTGPRSGMMPLAPGQQSGEVFDRRLSPAGKLPFDLRLRRSDIEYYQTDQPWRLILQLPQNGWMAAIELKWRLGREISVSGSDIRVTVLEYLPGEQAGPRMRVLVRCRDRGGEAWLAARDDAHGLLPLGALTGDEGGDEPALILARPQPQVRQYRSQVVVLRQGTPVVEDVIRVNHPLHYGGYHIYLSSVAPDGETFFMVKADTGLNIVYLGLALLCAGMFWNCWIAPAWARLRGRRVGQ